MRCAPMAGTFCPGISLFADNAAGTLTINGVSASGSTLTLELWNLDPGSSHMTEDVDHVLFTDTAGAYGTCKQRYGNPGHRLAR